MLVKTGERHFLLGICGQGHDLVNHIPQPLQKAELIAASIDSLVWEEMWQV